LGYFEDLQGEEQSFWLERVRFVALFSATGFPSREACIDFVMGRVDTLYLNPTGKYFRQAPCVGNMLFGMNVEYAAEADWGANVAIIGRQMEAAMG
jgi:hypothetical protein